MEATRHLTLLSYVWNRTHPHPARPFHVVNVLLHAVNAILVVRMTDSWMAGLVFLLHPLGVGAVAYISGRASLLSTFFGLLGVWAILSGYGAWAIPCWVLACFSKEDALGFAFTFGAISVYLHQSWGALWFAAPLLIVLATDRMRRGKTDGADRDLIRGGLPGSVKQPCHGIAVFTENVLHFPMWMVGAGFSTYHGSGIPCPLCRKSWRPVLAVAGLLVAAVIVPPLPFLLILCGPWLAYLVVRVPDVLLEYRNYFWLTGVSFMAPALNPPLYLAMPLILVFAIQSFLRTRQWATEEAFWKVATACGRGDKSRAWQELGAVYKLRITPAEQQGNAREAEHWAMEAIRCFETALHLNPNLAPARLNLAWTFVKQKRMGEAIAVLQACVKRTPLYLEAWIDLGEFYERVGQANAAELNYRHALMRFPTEARLHNCLGLVLYRTDRKEDAAQAFARALEIQEHLPFRYNCCVVSAELKREDDVKKFSARLPNPFTVNEVWLRQMIPQGRSA